MKGPCACILQAVKELAGKPLKRQLTLVFTAGEDTDGWFVTNIIKDRLVTRRDARYGIVAEPSLMTIIPAHKGIGGVEVTIHGKAAHSSRPEIGINAIEKCMLFLDELQKFQLGLFNQRHPLMGHTTVKPTLITGGFKWNIIPDSCSVYVNFRLIPQHEGSESINKMVEQVITACRERDQQFSADTKIIKASPALDVPVDSEVVSILKEILGTEPDGVPYATEAVDYTQAGIPTVICGPGSIDQAHAPDEYITLDQLQRGVQVFREVIETTCS